MEAEGGNISSQSNRDGAHQTGGVTSARLSDSLREGLSVYLEVVVVSSVIRRAGFACIFAASIWAVPISGPAQAQYCEGLVNGLSSHYNRAKGTGFLAVRSGPRGSARQVGELFNGDRVELFGRKGKWYKVAEVNGSVEGWAFAHYIQNDCDY